MQATKESKSFDKIKQVEPENVTELANCNHWESKQLEKHGHNHSTRGKRAWIQHLR